MKFLKLIVLPIMTICLAACHKDNDDNDKIYPKFISKEVGEFFNANLYSGAFKFSEMDENSFECEIVNSKEDFRNFVATEIEVPDIDFTKYTLILGQHWLNRDGYSLREQYINRDYLETGAAILTLNYRPLGGTSTGSVTKFHFYGIYPKLSCDKVSLNVNTK